MSPAEWGVVVGGVALIALINWYFFFSSPEATAIVGADSGIAEIPIVVRGGYSPGTVRVPRGARV
ncbi:MAG TPA: hypothetical protein PKH96_22720, partial [Gemmatimonadaceae bacterium]|nr:hypothetical protein [Gemmatimonadaceae bacterium]